MVGWGTLETTSRLRVALSRAALTTNTERFALRSSLRVLLLLSLSSNCSFFSSDSAFYVLTRYSLFSLSFYLV
jgi:hypothetical protein